MLCAGAVAPDETTVLPGEDFGPEKACGNSAQAGNPPVVEPAHTSKWEQGFSDMTVEFMTIKKRDFYGDNL